MNRVLRLSSLFLFLLVGSQFVAAAANAGHENAKIAAHVKPAFLATKTIPRLCDVPSTTTIEPNYSPSWNSTTLTPNPLPCSEYTTETLLFAGGGYTVYFVVGQAGTEGVAGASFGVDYNGRSGQFNGIDPSTAVWTSCADGLLLPNDGGFGNFPNPKGGARITWNTSTSCQTQEIGTDGVHAVIGALYVYTYAQDDLVLTPNNNVAGGPELLVADCSAVDTSLPLTAAGSPGSHLGKIRLGLGSGFNPCAAGGPAPFRIVSVEPVGFTVDGQGQIATTTDRIDVTFSGDVGFGAGTPGNYTISNTLATVVSAEVDLLDPTLVHLTLSAPIGPSNDFYAVTATGIGIGFTFETIVEDGIANRETFFLKSVALSANMSLFLVESSSPPDVFALEGNLPPLTNALQDNAFLLDPDLDQIYETTVPFSIPGGEGAGTVTATLNWRLSHNTSGLEPKSDRSHLLSSATGANDALAVFWNDVSTPPPPAFEVVTATGTGYTTDAQGQFSNATNKLAVRFSRSVGAGAATASNYSLADLPSTGISPISASVDPGDDSLVHLTFGSQLPIGGYGNQYELTVMNVQAADGAVIPADGIANRTRFLASSYAFRAYLYRFLELYSSSPDVFTLDGDLPPLTMTPGDGPRLLDPEGDGTYDTQVPFTVPVDKTTGVAEETLTWRIAHNTTGPESVTRSVTLSASTDLNGSIFRGFWNNEADEQVWGRQFGQAGDDQGSDVYADSTGVYVVGTTTPLGFPERDAFLAKYDHAGNFLWSRTFGSPLQDEGLGIDGDETGVYVVGTTAGALPGQVSSGSTDIFLRKYDADGVELWTAQFGSSGSDGRPDVFANVSGLFVSGTVRGSLLGQTKLGGGTDPDGFVARFSADGTLDWARLIGTYLSYSSFSGPRDDEAYALSGDASGVYVAGRTNGAFQGLVKTGLSDGFVTKFDFLGNRLWARQFGIVDQDYFVSGMSASETGIYLAASGYSLNPTLRKYDANGNQMWSRASTLLGLEGVSADVSKIHTVGTLQANNANDVVYSIYDLDGNLLETRRYGEAKLPLGYGVHASPVGNFITGRTGEALPGESNSGGYDTFLIKTGEGTQPPPPPPSLVSARAVEFAVDADGQISTQTNRVDVRFSGAAPPEALNAWSYSLFSPTTFTYFGALSAESDPADSSLVHLTLDGYLEPILSQPSYTLTTYGLPISGPESIDFNLRYITFQGNMTAFLSQHSNPPDVFTVEGDVYPLTPTPGDNAVLLDPDGDGVYVTTVPFSTPNDPNASHPLLKWRFHHNTQGLEPIPERVAGLISAWTNYEFFGNDIPGFVWSRPFETGGTSFVNGSVADDGSAYFFGSTVSGAPLAGQTDLGLRDFFLRKFDLDGNEIWTRQFGDAGDDQSLRAALDETGVYVVGSRGPLSPSSGRVAVVRKFDADGGELWTREYSTPGGTSGDYAVGVAAYGGAVYVAGRIDGALPGQTHVGGTDGYIRKYDQDGTELWTRQFGTAGNDDALYVAADAGGIYVTGRVAGFLSGSGADTSPRIYVRKVDPDGNEVWTWHSPNISESARGIATFGPWVYVAAIGSNPENFSQDVRVLKLDDQANLLWAKWMGTPATDQANSIVVATAGLFIAGQTTGLFPGGWRYLQAGQTTTGFLAYLDHDGDLISTNQPGGGSAGSTYNVISTNGSQLFLGSPQGVYRANDVPQGDFDLDHDGLGQSADICPFTGPMPGEVDRDYDGCPDETSSFRFVRFWDDSQLPLVFETDADGHPDIADGSDFSELSAAFAQWTSIPGVTLAGGDDGLRGGPSNPISGDRRNSLSFRDEDGFLFGTIAITPIAVALDDTVIGGQTYRAGQIVDADILFNTRDFRFNTPTYDGGPSAFDLRSVAVHEFGHFCGFSHTPVEGSTMFYVLPRGQGAASLEADDAVLALRGYGATTPQLSVEGRVLRPDGATPIVGAAVFAMGAAGDTVQMTFSGIDGTYRLYGLSGDITLSVHPIDGSAEVNGLTAPAVNSVLAQHVEVDFLPEPWNLVETDGDFGGTGDPIAVGGGPVTNVDFVTNRDSAAPEVVSTTPSPGEPSASAVGAILVEFNEKLDVGAFASNPDIGLRNLITSSGVAGSAAILRKGDLLVFTPSAPLAYDTDYELTVGPDIQDLSGNPMAGAVVVSFRTEPRPAPSLASLSPLQGPVGGQLVIAGRGFDPSPSANQVTFGGGITAVPVASSLDRLTVVVPAGADSGDVSVTVGGMTSNALAFGVLPPRDPPVANVVDQTAFFGEARTLDISFDGAQAFVATSEGIVIVDARPTSATFLQQSLVSIPGGIEDVVSLPVGNLALAIGSAPERLHLIDATTATAIQEFELPQAPLRIEVVPGGNEVVIAYPDRVVMVSTVPGPLFGQEIREWRAPGASFLGEITVSATGNEIYATTASGDVAVLGLGPQEGIVAVLDAGTTPREIAASPDGSGFVVVDAEGTARLYASRGPLLETYTVDGGFSALTFSPEGDYAFATNLVLNDVEVLNTSDGALTGEDVFETQVDPVDVETGGGGQYVYVLSGDANVLQVFDTQSGPRVRRISPSSGGTGTLLTVSGSGFDPTPANNTVAIGGAVHTPLAVDAGGTRLLVRQLAGAQSGALSVTVGSLASNAVPYRVVNRPDPGNFFPVGAQGTGAAQPLVRLAEAPNGGIVAGLHADGTLTVLQADPALDNLLRPIQTVAPAQSQLFGDGPMVFTPDSRKLFVGSGTEVAVFRVVIGAGEPMARIGTASQGGSAALLDPAELAVTPDGRRLLVRSAVANVIHEVDVATHEVLGTISGFSTLPTAMAVDPGGDRLFVGENGGGAPVVRVVDLDPASGTYRGLVGNAGLSGAEGPFQLAASPDGHRLYAVTALDQAGVLDSRLDVIVADLGAAFGQLVQTVPLGLETRAARILPNRSGTLVYVLRGEAGTVLAVDATTLALLPRTAPVPGLAAASDLTLSRDDARLMAPAGSDRLALVDLGSGGTFDLVSGFGQLGVAGVPLAAPLVIQTKVGAASAADGSVVRFRAGPGDGNFGFPDQQSFGVVDGGGFASANYVPGLSPGQDTIEILTAAGTLTTTMTVVSDTSGAPPELVAVRPGSGALLEPGVTTRVSADFSKSIEPSSVDEGSFGLRPVGGATAGGFFTFADDMRRVVFTPEAPLAAATAYELEITSGIRDKSGNVLVNPGVFPFSTSAFPPLALYAADPPAGGVGVPVVLSGQGFHPDPARNRVLFEGGREGRITSSDPGAILTSVPLGTTSGLVRVVADGDTSGTIPFAVLVPPPLPELEVTGEIQVPASGQQIAVLPDGSRAYMTSAGTNAVVPIRISDLSPEEPISTGRHPFGVAASPRGDRIFVTNFYSNTISVVDTDPASPSFHSAVATIPTAQNPTAIAVHPDGRSLYVVHYGEPTLMIVDTDPASATEYQARSNVDTGSGSKSVTVTPDGGLVVVGVSTGILVLNASDGSARSNVDTGSGSKAVTVTPDGAFALVLTEDSRLVLIDIQPGSPTEGQARSNVDTGSGSKSVTVSPDGGFAYVTREDGFVDVFQIQISGGPGGAVEAPGLTSPINLVLVASIEVGENPIGIAFDPSGSGLILVVNAGSLTITVLNGPLVDPTVEALVDVDPNALNLNSNGQYVMGYVQFPDGIDPDKVVVSSVRLESTVAADTTFGGLVDHNEDGILERSLRFSRTEVFAVLPTDQDTAWVEVTGVVDGLQFAGVDSIRLVRPKRWRPGPGDVVQPGGTAEVAWTPVDTTVADRVDIFFSPDGGDSWEPVTESAAEDTTYLWSVPEVLTTNAKLLLVARDSRRAGVRADGSLDGVQGYDGLDTPFTIDKASSVGEVIPLRFAVRPPLPNPSAGRTQLRFELPEAARVSVRVYAVDGSLVRDLVNEAPYPAGRHSVVWPGTDERGQKISSGVYFVRITSGKNLGIQKLVRLP